MKLDDEQYVKFISSLQGEDSHGSVFSLEASAFAILYACRDWYLKWCPGHQYSREKARQEKLSAEQTAHNSQSDEIIAGIKEYVNKRIEDTKHDSLYKYAVQELCAVRSLLGAR